MEELTAVYLHERRRFKNVGSDTIIASIRPVDEEDEVGLKGSLDDGEELEPRCTYRFWGYWTTYRNEYRGTEEKQFSFRSFVEVQPHGEAGITTYLMTLKRIGGVAARKMWRKYESDAVKVLRQDPDRVAKEIAGLSLETCRNAARVLEQKFRIEGCSIELIELMDGRGFPKGTAKRAIKEWGNKAPELIRKNPYLLMNFRGCGFGRCDALYLAMKHPPDALKRQALCAWNAIARDQNGHTWFPEEFVVQSLIEQIGGTKVRAKDAIRLAVRAGLLRDKYHDGYVNRDETDFYWWKQNQRWLALAEKAKAEATVAKIVRRMMKEPGLVPGNLDVSEHQAAAVDHMTRRIEILGGGPGTGKTYVAAQIIKWAIGVFGKEKVAVGAPTGKAAVRVTEAMAANGINLVAKTWHSLLEVEQVSETGGWAFSRNEDNPFPHKFLVGDESSMLDTNLMASVLRAIPPDCQLLLVGDVCQLPPVGHGAPLRDMITAGVPYSELTEVRRNSGKIVEVCHAIRTGKPWMWKEPLDHENNLGVCLASTPEQQFARLLDLIRECNQDWQVIVPVNRKSPLARKKLNEILQAEFNSNDAVPGSPFRLADKVVNTRNSQLELVDEFGIKQLDEDGEPKRCYVANGEMGVIDEAELKRIFVKLESPDRRVVVPRGKQDDDDEEGTGTGCNWELGYAISCHKSQGSEWPVVMVMLDEYPGAMRLCDRSWLYTAISRAKKLCLLIGKKGTADAMCSRVNIGKRKTFLKELIRD